MIRTVRWRIGLSVFLVFAGLQLVLSLYLLDRWKCAAREAIDGNLSGRIRTLNLHVNTPELGLYIRFENEENTQLDENFFEVRTPSGEVLARSPNVPEHGLGAAASDDVTLRRVAFFTEPVSVWEGEHPHSPNGERSIRIAQLSLGGLELRVAKSLDRMRLDYFDFRRKLLRGILGVSLLGAAGAWWVARRSLAPVQAMTLRARELRSVADGLLPRTESGDELDHLGSVLNDLLDAFRGEVLHVRRISADAAHALRTPLAAIRAALELRIQPAGDAEDPALVPILERLDDTIGVVNRLLLLESIESNRLDLESAEGVALDALIEDLVSTLEPVAMERRIQLKRSLARVQVRGDPAQLRSAVLNLIENALQHTPAGGWITVTLGALEREAWLRVEDSGTGLRPDQLERVFERFYSERRASGGTGLGLAIARAIAHAHHGSLTASSPGGACFELRLPLGG